MAVGNLGAYSNTTSATTPDGPCPEHTRWLDRYGIVEYPGQFELDAFYGTMWASRSIRLSVVRGSGCGSFAFITGNCSDDL